jgi:DNA-directed RNA polymerase II subunit RPB4
MNFPFFRLCEWADFVKAKCLMNAEVALVLQRKYEQLQQLSDDPVSQISQVFEKSLQYVKRFSRYQNPEAVKQVREVLTRNKLHEFEVCLFSQISVQAIVGHTPILVNSG